MTNKNGPAVGVRNSAVRPPFDVDVAPDTRPTGHRRSRNAKAKSCQGTKSIRTVDFGEGGNSTNTRSTGHRRSRHTKSVPESSSCSIGTADLFDDDEGNTNTRSAGQRRSRNARSFQEISIRTADFDGDEGDANTRPTGQRRPRNTRSFQGKSIGHVDFDGDEGDGGPAAFRDSFPLSRKEERHQKSKTFHCGHRGHNRKHADLFGDLDDDGPTRHKKNTSFHGGNNRNHAELFAELFAELSEDGLARHQQNSSFNCENSRMNDDLSYDGNDHGSSFKQALAETRPKHKSFHVVRGNDNDGKPTSTRSSSHKSFHAVDPSGNDNDNRPSKTRRSPQGRPNLGRTLRPGDYKSRRRASVESTKSSTARETYLPRLELGDAGSHDDMITENDPQAALELLDDSLEKHSFCFTRRSNGTFTYSIVAEKDDRSITVVVDEIGSTKACLRKDWPANFRLVNKMARQKKLDEKSLRKSTTSGVLSLFD